MADTLKTPEQEVRIKSKEHIIEEMGSTPVSYYIGDSPRNMPKIGDNPEKMPNICDDPNKIPKIGDDPNEPTRIGDDPWDLPDIGDKPEEMPTIIGSLLKGRNISNQDLETPELKEPTDDLTI